MRRVGAGGAGGQIFNIGKSRASLYDKENKVNVTFNDVAGQENVKREVSELVDFLRNPQDYLKLGAEVPRGVLLMGPPGTGKTLMARALAGEAVAPVIEVGKSLFESWYTPVRDENGEVTGVIAVATDDWEDELRMLHEHYPGERHYYDRLEAILREVDETVLVLAFQECGQNVVGKFLRAIEKAKASE